MFRHLSCVSDIHIISRISVKFLIFLGSVIRLGFFTPSIDLLALPREILLAKCHGQGIRTEVEGFGALGSQEACTTCSKKGVRETARNEEDTAGEGSNQAGAGGSNSSFQALSRRISQGNERRTLKEGC